MRVAAEWATPLVASINIVEAHDVVFTEIAADLHFDEFKWDSAGLARP
jgi:hypothetical protein